MELLTPEARDRMLANGRASEAKLGGIDHPPVVKLFMPDAGATWLLSELNPHDEDIAFGLCDLGMGEPELGYVRISSIAALRGGLRLPPERDLSFSSDLPLANWAGLARRAGSISGAEQNVRDARSRPLSIKDDTE